MGNFFEVDLAALAQFVESLSQSDDHMNEALNDPTIADRLRG